MRIHRRRTADSAINQFTVEEKSQFIPVGFEGVTPSEPKLFALQITPAEAAALGVPGPTVDVFWVQTIGRLGVGDPALFNSPYDMPLDPDYTLHVDESAYEAALLTQITQHLVNMDVEYMANTDAQKLAFADSLLFLDRSGIRPL